MLKLLIFLVVVLTISFRKDNSDDIIKESLVETSLRLDTIAYDKVSSSSCHPNFYLEYRPYFDPALNPNYPINHSAIYRYEIAGDTIWLNSFYCSYGGLLPCSFKRNNSSNFTIGKFYNRAALPAMLEFEKIK